MVRLVFRPYTQIRRTICTSVSLRASTRVSPGFALFRHRSPSFGSQQICSDSNPNTSVDRPIVPSPCGEFLPSHFHCALGFNTQILAYMLDSLVRVSRRVIENHFVSIARNRRCRASASTNCARCHNFVVPPCSASRTKGARAEPAAYSQITLHPLHGKNIRL
jgi:hypothetical protein